MCAALSLSSTVFPDSTEYLISIRGTFGMGLKAASVAIHIVHSWTIGLLYKKKRNYILCNECF